MSMRFKLLGFLCTCQVLVVGNAKVSYAGYKVYRFTPSSEDHTKLLQELQDAGIDFWTGPSPPGRTSDAMFSPEQQVDLLNKALSSGMKNELYISDVQDLLNVERVGKVRTIGEIDWYDYYQLEDIYAHLDRLAVENPYVEVIKYGQSYESRDLKVVKISKFCETGETKPIIFIEANTHAREWITSAVATYIINELLCGTLQERLDQFDFYIVPVGNPDGYVYTHTESRAWRKTRSLNKGSECVGTDPNRNWDDHWMTGGSSVDPCSNVYAGTAAFSEVEIRSLAEYYKTIGNDVSFFLTLHSHGQMFLLPWGYTLDHIPDYDRYMEVAKNGAAALETVNGTKYTWGSIPETIYIASGGSLDWILGKFPNIRLALCAELRDKGKYGFLLPAHEILPTGEELVAALNVFMDHVC